MIVDLLTWLVALGATTALIMGTLGLDAPFPQKWVAIGAGIWGLGVLVPWLANPLPYLELVFAVATAAALVLFLGKEPHKGEIGGNPNDPNDRR
ncbi:MAG: hypothetical protein AAB421_01310 [Patescibacteria group bacterium]